MEPVLKLTGALWKGTFCIWDLNAPLRSGRIAMYQTMKWLKQYVTLTELTLRTQVYEFEETHGNTNISR